MSILVTGGAGYIGSIVTETLLNKGEKVVVLDNLKMGHREAVLRGAKFILADICDSEVIENIFRRFSIEAVMYLAAETQVHRSMTDPKHYFYTNVACAINFLNTMLRYGVDKFIFSSSAAVYGEPKIIPIQEKHPTVPINSYGESKLMFEHILEWYGKSYKLKHVSLRYFNAAGASKILGEDHRPETHLIPNILKAALNQRGPIFVYGNDYSTEDGSCIRDYVHVIDIAYAHLLALQKIESLTNVVYNLGNGGGYSVIEVIEVARKVTGINIPVEIRSRRLGDPPILVADAKQAVDELGWEPRFPELESIIKSAWIWTKQNPNGYG